MTRRKDGITGYIISQLKPCSSHIHYIAKIRFILLEEYYVTHADYSIQILVLLRLTKAIFKHTSSLYPAIFYYSMKNGFFVSKLQITARDPCFSCTQSTEILTSLGTCIRIELQNEGEGGKKEMM